MKNLANFKVAVKTREYLIQAIFQMLFSNQKATQIIDQFMNEHKNRKGDFDIVCKLSKFNSRQYRKNRINSYIIKYKRFKH